MKASTKVLSCVLYGHDNIQRLRVCFLHAELVCVVVD